MQGDPLHALAEVGPRLKALSAAGHRLAAKRDQAVEDLARIEKEVFDLSNRIEKLSKVGELFRVLLDMMVDKQVRAVEGIVTQGLRTIFHDLDLQFEAEVGTRYNRIAVDFFIRQGTSNGRTIRGKPLTAFGGGPSSVASLTLRILTILRLKLWPFLILDETLAAVSDEYVEQTGQFLAGLASKMHMDILLVTHKSSFLEHADHAYRCAETVEEDGSRHLLLRSLK